MPNTQFDYARYGYTAHTALPPMAPQTLRILITKDYGATGLDAELVQHVFEEVNRMPDAEASYVIERFISGEACSAVDDGAPDTLIVTGCYDHNRSHFSPGYLAWLKETCAKCRRIVAIAGGAFPLAAIGLLRNATAVSHWSAHDCFQGKYPSVSVRSDILFTQHGKVFTCAGSLASIDLALHLVEEDRGSVVAKHVAQRLLLPYRRTAACSQVSLTLKAQDNVSAPISELLAWLPHHLNFDLSISKLARRVAMSQRNFARRFREQVMLTPARYIEDLRFEAAKRELARKGQTVSGAAEMSGFNNAESLRRLFQRRVGLTPRDFRDRTNPQSVPSMDS